MEESAKQAEEDKESINFKSVGRHGKLYDPGLEDMVSGILIDLLLYTTMLMIPRFLLV